MTINKFKDHYIEASFQTQTGNEEKAADYLSRCHLPSSRERI